MSENKLKGSKSLYLLQHADNPVAWQTWGTEAFSKAVEEDKPLLISVGYSSCHWCHVMARESFENAETAKYINENFIPVKVDREEYPDVDKRFQFYLQTTTGHGGWPLTVFTTPKLEPFFAGTYFPDKQMDKMPSFRQVLEKIVELYKSDKEQVREVIKNYTDFKDDFLKKQYTFDDLKDKDINIFLNAFVRGFDEKNGGMGNQAKFPHVPSLMYLTDYFDDEQVRKFLLRTADMMCLSGLNDHINGGFFRYTVDPEWKVPHFEKMLYDNALNPLFLTRMFELTDNMLYLHTARKALDFTLNNFASEFGMASAMNAESIDNTGKPSEGFFYRLFPKDIEDLNTEERELFDRYVYPHEGLAYVAGADYEKYLSLEPIFEKIAAKAKEGKPKPDLDTKVILSQNALFCKALLKYGEISSDEYYMSRAQNLLGTIKHFMVTEEELFHVHYEGDTLAHATLEDYAYLTDLYTTFFEITREKQFLQEAGRLIRRAEDIFYDKGVFYLDKEHVTAETFDDSTPAPSAVIIENILNHGVFAGIEPDGDLLDFSADRIIRFYGGHPTLIRAVKKYLELQDS